MTTTNEPNLLARTFGANYQTTLSSWGGSIMAALTFVSGLSYDIGPLALIIKPEWKSTITTVAGIATVLLWAYNGVQQKSKNVTGGAIQQDASGNVTGAAKEVAPATTIPKYPLK